jgi:hypothetical protein
MLSVILYAMTRNGEKRMRVFKNKPFARFARKNELDDEELCKAVDGANRGLIDADLGGGVIKQRVARRGAGKSGGFRAVIVFRIGELAVFVHGFAKSEVENVRPDELSALKKLASEILAYSQDALEMAVQSGTLMEVQCNGKREAVS